jgi:hypothetical protein
MIEGFESGAIYRLKVFSETFPCMENNSRLTGRPRALTNPWFFGILLKLAPFGPDPILIAGMTPF